MEPADEIKILNHMLGEFRQALADSQFALANANARLTVQAELIASLQPADN